MKYPWYSANLPNNHQISKWKCQRKFLCKNKWKIKINTSPCMKRKCIESICWTYGTWQHFLLLSKQKKKFFFASTSFRLLFLCIKKRAHKVTPTLLIYLFHDFHHFEMLIRFSLVIWGEFANERLKDRVIYGVVNHNFTFFYFLGWLESFECDWGCCDVFFEA